MTIFQKYINLNEKISATCVRAGDLRIEKVAKSQESKPVSHGWPAECLLFLSKFNVSYNTECSSSVHIIGTLKLHVTELQKHLATEVYFFE